MISVECRSRDRFLNFRTADGTDHFGISFSSALTAVVSASGSVDGRYSIRYWAPDAVYNNTMFLCGIAGPDDFSPDGCRGAEPASMSAPYEVTILQMHPLGRIPSKLAWQGPVCTDVAPARTFR